MINRRAFQNSDSWILSARAAFCLETWEVGISLGPCAGRAVTDASVLYRDRYKVGACFPKRFLKFSFHLKGHTCVLKTRQREESETPVILTPNTLPFIFPSGRLSRGCDHALSTMRSSSQTQLLKSQSHSVPCLSWPLGSAQSDSPQGSQRQPCPESAEGLGSIWGGSRPWQGVTGARGAKHVDGDSFQQQLPSVHLLSIFHASVCVTGAPRPFNNSGFYLQSPSMGHTRSTAFFF